MRELHVETITHGRVLIEDAASRDSRRWLIGFHGYGQAAEDIFNELQQLNPAREWSIAAPQALHRFYTRGDERVVASWMTRQDRDVTVADNVSYVDRLGLPLELSEAAPIVFLGFSQGAAMAYRAAVLSRFDAAAVVALAGDIPPEVRAADPAVIPRRLRRVLIGAGTRDAWFNQQRLEADTTFLTAHGVTPEVCRFEGGHEWTEEFRVDVRRILAALLAPR